MFRYLLDLREPGTAATALGRAFHETIAHNFRQKAETAHDLPVAECLDCFRKVLGPQLEEAKLQKGEHPMELLELGETMVTKYIEDAAPLIRPAAVESRVSGVIGGVKVSGYVDLLDIEGRIIDAKSALKPLKGIAHDHHLQLTSYVMITPAASGACRLDTVSAMTRLWLIRHGEPAEEARHRCYGSLDIGLSETGRAQMAQVAEYLKTEPVAAIYTSSRSRALESARILAAVPSCPIEVVADLREIDFGEFEGLPYDEIAARYPDIYRQWMETPTEVRFPNGESFSEMRGRILRAFDAIQREREGQTVAIVSHGGVNRILIAWALQMPDNCLFRLAQDYAAVNLLALVDGLPSLQLLNYQLVVRRSS